MILVLFTGIRIASPAELNLEVSKIERLKESPMQLTVRVESSEFESMSLKIAYYFDREATELRLVRMTSSKEILLIVMTSKMVSH